jgi:hypothetical protein
MQIRWTLSGLTATFLETQRFECSVFEVYSSFASLFGVERVFADFMRLILCIAVPFLSSCSSSKSVNIDVSFVPFKSSNF